MNSQQKPDSGLTRREVLSAGLGASALAGGLAPAIVRAAGSRGQPIPTTDSGVQIGDLRGDSAVIWSRTDRDARMRVRWSTAPDFSVIGGEQQLHTLQDTDYTGKILLNGLPAGEEIHYAVDFLNLADYRSRSEVLTGHFRTPPAQDRDIRFLWSGDNVGQGWGINPDIGGMPIYRRMAGLQPDFFIHSGDTIYADGPLSSSVELEDGRVWRNLVTEPKSRVAESLDDFRGQYRYNLLDDGFRDFYRNVPVIAQWDDHEVTNNWFWELRKNDDPRYTEPSVARLAARAMRAFQEYNPTRRHPLDPERIYDRFPYGPALEVFRIDLRSYRGPNSDEQPTTLSPESRIIGQAQLRWLKRALVESTATWKVIASDMPLGVVIYDDWREQNGAEGIALQDGPAAGRELEIADLLTHLRDHGVENIVWLTADVHYTAAHYYDPGQASYPDFAPFWEFVSGPLHAGTFGGNPMDNTFGPQVVYQRGAPEGTANLSPLSGMQFFGQVDIAAESHDMTVTLKDTAGTALFTKVLQPT
ncbi:MAG: alkaline phosphatase [Chromatocurvus sp.]